MGYSLLLVTKKRIYLITLVDRETRCFLGWKVAWERSKELIQAIIDHAPKATWYDSDAFDVYASLWYYWGRYAVSEGKTDTYSVEGNNAELRHYLARLARSSRCFSRGPYMPFTARFVGLSITSINAN